VVGALDAGVAQVVAAARLRRRALRYAKPGVRWFEVDHPDTQQDKLERLTRLGIDTGHVGFVAADFTTDDVAAGLAAAGHDAGRPTLFLCEGVAVYLDAAVLEIVARRPARRGRAGAGCISLSTSNAGVARRAAFRAAWRRSRAGSLGAHRDEADACSPNRVVGGHRSEPGAARGAGLVVARPS